MLKKISISNYKSIKELDFDLGRINVLIGENGAGKSNILEAIALAGAAASDKLDNEFLASRGIRVTQPEHMRSAFPAVDNTSTISINIIDLDGKSIKFNLENDNSIYSKWNIKPKETIHLASKNLKEVLKEVYKKEISDKELESFKESLLAQFVKPDPSFPIRVYFDANESSFMFLPAEEPEYVTYLKKFIVFSPENNALKQLQSESQIEPLGIKGEGILRLMSVLQDNAEYHTIFYEIIESLKLFGWFDGLNIIDDEKKTVKHMRIKDRYLDESKCYFDQMSTNEGFLFLVFYFALFSCDLTPNFFAVDNIDASLNPKLCSMLMEKIVELAKKNNKQVILTAHNPAILDGLNINDDNQRLFIVSRNPKGHTRLKRVTKKEDSQTLIKLSEAFMRGSLGGLPKGF